MADASDFTPVPRKAAPVAEVIEPPAKGHDVPATADMFTATTRRQESTAASLWNGLLNFGQGVAEGIGGAHVPEGRASEYEGGRSGFGGRMVGAGTRGLAEGLWEAIKTPGQVMMGEKQPTAQNALGTSLLMAGQGWRHPMGATPQEAFAGVRPVGELLRNTEGSAPNPFAGGRVDPLPSAGEIRQQPTGLPMGSAAMGEARPGVMAPSGGQAIPSSAMGEIRQQPPNLIQGGAFMPEARPGVPPQPGARLTMETPVPNIPTGMQPPRGGPALPEQQPGIPTRPGGSAGLGPPAGPMYQQPRNLPLGSGDGIPGRQSGGPTPPGGLTQALPSSPLSDALATGDGGLAERTLTNAYRRAVQPKKLGRDASNRGLDVQDQRIVTAVDQIIANRPNLRLTDAAGNETAQQLPQSLRQFAQAIDQTKRDIFGRYDKMAQEAGAGGVQVDLRPVAAHLRQIAETPEVRDLHPGLAEDAARLASTWEQRGFYSPGQAQDVIQNLNQTLAGFWRAPTHETVSRTSLLAPVSTMLRKALDEAIETSQGGGYQALRTRYQALRSVERDVANAVQKNANKIPGGFAGELADMASAELFLHGILTMNPSAIGRAATTRAAKAAVKYLNDPNRAVTRMFNQRADPASFSRLSPSIPREIRGGLAGGYDAPTPSDDKRLLKRTILPEARP